MERVLQNILTNLPVKSISGDNNCVVNDIAFDSRLVKKGTLFIAQKGLHTDGHQFIETAIQNGAVAIVCEQLPNKKSDKVTFVQVGHSKKALSVIASNFFGNPSQKLTLVGITGTNGKTTIATLLHQLFSLLGYPTGLLSTISNIIIDRSIDATHTTPDAIQINNLMHKMVEAGCRFCFMEVSSHAIDQDRIYGLDFNGAIFTNITHEHLDYHHDFKSYINAKKAFFDQLSDKAFALVNKDDRNASIMVQNTRAKVYGYALKAMADFKGKIVEADFNGMMLYLDNMEFWTKLTGSFNASNILAIYATAILLGEDRQLAVQKLSLLEPAEGRFNTQYSKAGKIGVVDYAHTPDALENVLITITDLKQNQQKLITVVGAGGNRDKGKRPLMAQIAVKYSDKVIFTSDNPRNEPSSKIIEDMLNGLTIEEKQNQLVIEDRKEAIKAACMLAGKSDIILIAGKGHEKYQEIKGQRYPFDDIAIIREIFKYQ